MDFIAQKQRILQEMSPLVNDCKKAEKSLDLITKRAADTEGIIERLTAENQKLTDSADDALASSQGDFEKFKLSLRKNNASIEANKEALKVLTDKIIPAKRRELNDLRGKLTTAFFIAFGPVYAETQAQITEKLNDCVNLHDDFIETIFDGLTQTGLPEVDAFTYRISSTLEPVPRHPRIGVLSTAVAFLGLRKPASPPLISTDVSQITVTPKSQKPVPVIEPAQLEKLSPDQTDPEAPGVMVEQKIPEPVVSDGLQSPEQWSKNVFGDESPDETAKSEGA
jgi:hypothetical protein